MATIQDFYKQTLTALRYQVDDEDLISFKDLHDRVTPAVIDGRRLVLPSKARLREGFDDDLQPFHPLSENIARRSASPVLKGMQRTAKAVLAHYFTELSLRLLAVAADPSLHKDLPPACSEYLKKVPNADKKTLKAFEQLIGKAVQKNQLITLYLRNGGTLDGKKMNRLAVIRFPIMDVLNEDQPFGVKLRKKDRETLQALFHHVMPFGDSPEEYSAGSNSRVAPFLDAFLQAYAKTATQLNSVVRKYAKPLEIPLEPIDLTYTEHLENLGKFYEKIPSLRGNDGDSKEEAVEASETSIKGKATTAKQSGKSVEDTPPWEEQPGKPTASKPAERGGMSVDDFMKTLSPQNPQQQNPYAAPTQPSNPYAQSMPGPTHTSPGPVAPYGNPAQPNMGYSQYGNYGGGWGDPRRPAWLGGGNPSAPVQPSNPFAAALMSGGSANPPGGGYGYGTPYPPAGGSGGL